MALKPGSTIGILGAGQLGKMLAEAANKLGYKTHVFAPDSDPIAKTISDHFTAAQYTDLEALQTFAASIDVITLEFENVPVGPLKTFKTPVYPSPSILEISQHRLREKQFAQSLSIETAPFQAVTSNEQFHAAIKNIGMPAILKTSCMGYDGKGQWKVKADNSRHPRQNYNPGEDLGPDALLPEIPAQGGDDKKDFILEGFVRFTKEISVIVARNADGQVECFEPVENVHLNHILHTTTAPANISRKVADRAIEIATLIATKLELIGLLAIELFVTEDERVIFNEMAPRPHNSGHWTIEGCSVSQFEQAILAVTGNRLKKPERKAPQVVMTNLIGDDISHLDPWKKPNAHITIYGKKETRPGRKMGHVTVLKP